MSKKKKKSQNNNLFLDLIFSILVPSLLLTKGANYFPNLSAIELFLLALSIPILYGIYDFITNKHFNVISLAGLLNVTLTGGVGLFQASKLIIVIKEAGFPLILGLLMIIFNSRLQEFIKNQAEEILNVTLIISKSSKIFFNNWVKWISKQIPYTFFLSSILNGIMTIIIIQSQPGTQSFNEEIAKLLIWGFLGVAIPCMIVTIAIMIVGFKKLQKKTELKFEELFNEMK